MLACCTGNTSPEAVVDDLDALIRELRNEGAAVNIVGSISQPFFSASGQVLRVNGEDVQVFEYENAAAAQGEAARVSPDGSSVGTTIITWVSTPHFYRSGRVIVLYVGRSRELLSLLDSVLGPQFAGG
jgi:hypothetical protein